MMREVLLSALGLILIGLAVVTGLPDRTWSYVFSGLAVLVLYPERHQKPLSWLFWTSVIFFMFFLFSQFQIVFIPLGFGLLVTFILDPLVTRLHRIKIPRFLSSLVIIVFFALITLFLIGVVVYQAGNQAAYLISVLPSWIEKWRTTLQSYFRDPKIWEFLTQWSSQTGVLKNIVQNIGTLPFKLFGVANYMFIYLMTLVTAFYLLADKNRVVNYLKSIMSRSEYYHSATNLLGEISDVLHRYFRGQLIDASAVGILTGILLFIFNIKFALLLGFLAGVFNMIPNIGFWASYIPAALVGLMDPSPIWGFIRVSIVFGGVQLTESLILSPRIIGGSVGLHPLIILFSLLIGAKLLGILGLLLAVPTAATLKALIQSKENKDESVDE